jgi:hypothetical protein
MSLDPFNPSKYDSMCLIIFIFSSIFMILIPYLLFAKKVFFPMVCHGNDGGAQNPLYDSDRFINNLYEKGSFYPF